MSTLKSIADASQPGRLTEGVAFVAPAALAAPRSWDDPRAASSAVRTALGDAAQTTQALHATQATVPSLTPFQSLGPLRRDESCDVLIIGGGITGAFVAQQLATSGVDVVLVDRAEPAGGATHASTALIQYELDLPLVELIPLIGIADAQAVYRLTRSALDDLRTLIEDRQLECDLVPRPALYLARSAQDVPHLQHESIAREQIGISAPFLDGHALDDRYGINRPGALRSPLAYELDPRKLTFALLADAAAHGARVYDRTSVAADPWVGGLPAMRSGEGHSIHCEHVVYATGYAAVEQFPALRALCELRTTFTVVARPRDHEPSRWWCGERPLLWELGDPYFYARSTAGGQLIVGGEDLPLLTPDNLGTVLPAKTEALLRELERTTGIRELAIERAYGATFAHTPDGLPFVGSPDCSARCFFALGYGGNGILFSLIVAGVIRDRLLGQSHPGERLFAFDRKTAPRRAPFGGHA